MVNKDGLASGGSPSATKSNPPAEVKPTKATKQNEANAVYNNCFEVKEAGKAPIKSGQAGYSGKLDRDGDGIATPFLLGLGCIHISIIVKFIGAVGSENPKLELSFFFHISFI
jgi:hypothetical protein